MSCGHCSARVEAAFNEIKGVSAKVNLEEKIAYLQDAGLYDKLLEEEPSFLEELLEDEKKKGGKYVTVTGVLKKIDSYTHQFVLESGEEIPVEDIVSLEFENI